MLRPSLLALLCAACNASLPTPSPGSSPGNNQGARALVRQIQSSSDLVSGPVAGGKFGDWLIANDKVRFVIENVGPSDGYDPFGGGIVASDLVRPAGETGKSRFGEVFTSIAFRGFGADRIDVVSDGSDGDEARLRVTGHDDAIPLLAGLFAEGSEPAPLGVTILRDYVLKPGETVLHVIYTVQNNGAADLPASQVLTGIVMNRGQQHWAQKVGFSFATALPTSVPVYISTGPDVSYGLFNAREDLTLKVMFAKVVFVQQSDLAVPGGQSRSFELDYAVGNGDAASVLSTEIALRGDRNPAATINGTVVDAAGASVSGARVHVANANGVVISYARTSADGTFSMLLWPGNYNAFVGTDDRAPIGPSPFTVSSGGATVTLAVGAAGRAHLSANENGLPVPAKFTLQRTQTTPALPPRLGESDPIDPRIFFAPTGALDITLPPGTYDVYASRGLEYDLWHGSIDVGAIAPAAQATLHHVVDTVGQLSGDFHIHARWSADGEDLQSEKIAAAAAEGLEIPISTEHEFIGDFGSAVADLGLASYVHAMAGTEITTISTGHFNVFPLVPQLDKVNRGAFQWFGLHLPDVLRGIRQVTLPIGVTPIVQMNHPRSLGMAYLDTVAFDPDTFQPRAAPGEWWTDFDCMEIWNGGSIENIEGSRTVRHGTMPDWFSFLNHGVRITGTGNSDSHKATHNEVGFPRNLVAMPTNDPSRASDVDLVRNLRAGRSVVNGGIQLTSKIGFKGPGEIAFPEGDGKVRLVLRVQAPTWAGPVESVAVIGNGQIVATLTRGIDYTDDATTTDRAVLKNGAPLVLTPGKNDTWYVVRAKGSKSMWPVVGNNQVAYGFTNPIYVDGNRDGQFTAPMQQ